MIESYNNETNKDLQRKKLSVLVEYQKSRPCPYMPDITREQLCESLHSTIIGIENHRNQLVKKEEFGEVQLSNDIVDALEAKYEYYRIVRFKFIYELYNNVFDIG